MEERGNDGGAGAGVYGGVGRLSEVGFGLGSSMIRVRARDKEIGVLGEKGKARFS